MNSYLDLVSKYSKVHKKKNRLTVICIAISVMLVAAIFGMADMSVKGQISEQIRKGGNYHVMVNDISEEVAGQIASREDVAVSGFIAQSESVNMQGTDLLVMGGDKAISEQMNLAVDTGNFPASETEALIDRAALEQFHISIGDTASVKLFDGRMIDFAISGTFSDFTSLQGTGSHGLYLSLDGIKALAGSAYQGIYVVQFKNGTNIRGAISDIQQTLGLSDKQVIENKLLLGVMGQSEDSTMMQLYLMAGILFVLVLMAGTFMIASSFNLSVSERVKFFGMLRCLGATKRQVKRYVRLEGLRYCLTGVPIGLLAGCILMWFALLLLRLTGSDYFMDMPLFQISWIGLLAGTVMGFLTVMLASRSPSKKASRVSPQAAVTGNADSSSQQAANKEANTNRFHVETAMGIRHAFQSRKNVFLMTGSFAISIIMFLCFTVLISFMNHAIKPLRPYAPDISITAEDNSASLSPALLKNAAEIKDVTNVFGRMFSYDIPAENQADSKKVNLISYEDKQFDWAHEQLIRGDMEAVKSGTGVLVVYSGALKWDVGDTITLQLPNGKQDVQIAGILSNSPFDAKENTLNVICSEQTFTVLTGISDYTVIDIQVEEKADSSIASAVRKLLPQQMKLIDKVQSNRDIRMAYNSMSVFIYGFLIVIALVALINIVNTISASVSGRMNHYGVMRAVGMSVKQLKRMITVEAATYAVTGSVVGSVLGLFLHRLLFDLIIGSIWGETWQAPVIVLVVTIGAALLTTIIAVISPAREIEKMSIVNVVNAE
ncbi:ABC transporter permease [Acetobacterium carbinolicum]|uniref:ABC transporter permease n=1 Tax=Acetobacterium carbinolicum TaxID=52690 RepID=UPI0039BF546F